MWITAELFLLILTKSKEFVDRICYFFNFCTLQLNANIRFTIRCFCYTWFRFQMDNFSIFVQKITRKYLFCTSLKLPCDCRQFRKFIVYYNYDVIFQKLRRIKNMAGHKNDWNAKTTQNKTEQMLFAQIGTQSFEKCANWIHGVLFSRKIQMRNVIILLPLNSEALHRSILDENLIKAN